MSLKQFIKESPEVRRRFDEVLPKSDLAIRPLLVKPPQKYSAQKASLIGTAFDYLLRFRVQHLNAPVVKTRRWIAEAVVEHLEDAAREKVDCFYEQYVADAVKARRILEDARQHLSSYLSLGIVSDVLINSVLSLATLDPIWRAGRGYETIGVIDANDASDVRQLINVVDDSLFKATHLCLLNPRFNGSPDFALGADADLLVDDAIIEIKTSQTLRLNRCDLRQLIGYYLLNELVGFSGVTPRPMVTKVGIYFSRHACLHMIPIRQFITENTLTELLPWFKQEVTDYSPQDLDWQQPPADH